MRFCFTVSAVLWLGFPGCSSVPLSRHVETRELRIENRSGLPLRLTRVGGGSIALGSAARLDIELECDRYVLHAGYLRIPVPLLGELIADSMSVRVEAPAVAPSGFVFVPGGPTLIGDALGVGAEDERPARILGVESFLLARHETTNAEFVEFLNARGRCDEAWLDLGGPKCRIARRADGRFATDAPDLPVVTVALSGAREYCAWRSEVTGSVHRLPTEAEWERAARGPESSTYAYGDVYSAGAANQESGVLMPVGRFGATGWGFFDLTGNAFEWTESEYQPGLQVLRGGSYVLDGPYLRNSFRMWYRPAVQADDIGFRVLREIDDAASVPETGGPVDGGAVSGGSVNGDGAGVRADGEAPARAL